MTVEYTAAGTGGWLALCANERVLLLQPSAVTDAPLTTALLVALRETVGLQSVLDLLARGGLAAMPQFALLDVRDTPRVIVRGGVTVTVTVQQSPLPPLPPTTSAGQVGEGQISGAGVTTWTEQVLPSATALAVTVEGAEAVASVVPLPLVDGAAWVAALSVTVIQGTLTQGPVTQGSIIQDAGTQASTQTTAPTVSPVSTPSSAPAPVPLPEPEPEPDSEPDPGVTVVELPDPADLANTDLPVTDLPVTDLPVTDLPVTDLPVTAPPVTARSDSADRVAGVRPPEEPSQNSSYDYLFGDTMYRDVAGAAVVDVAEHAAGQATEDGSAGAAGVPEPQTSAAPVGASESAGDHDGQTVLTSDIAKLRAERKAKRASRSTGPAAPAAPPAPTVVLTLPNGTRESLAQPVLVGRAPSVSQVSGGNIPRLVTVGTADQDISRTHARFVLEGGTVVVTDLHSRNGTMIVLPGKEPQKLRAGEPTAVIVGTVIDFGGGITLTVEEN